MDDNINFKSFINNIKKVNNKRVHSVTNSYGIIDGFNFYKLIRPKDKKYIITISQYRSITRLINNKLRELLSLGNDIELPYNMGNLEIRKTKIRYINKNGKYTSDNSIDWNETLKLWYKDKDSYNKKTLIRSDSNIKYLIYYNKYKAKYINKSFYKFSPNRVLKKMLIHNIKESNLEAFTYNTK